MLPIELLGEQATDRSFVGWRPPEGVLDALVAFQNQFSICDDFELRKRDEGGMVAFEVALRSSSGTRRSA